MTLSEAEERYLGKLCQINWEVPGGRKEALVPLPFRNCLIIEIWEDCCGAVYFKSSKTACPFLVSRLTLETIDL